MREIPLTVVRGFVMGAADVVPGVSGGTVALVFGIYHRLIEAIRTGSSALGRFLRLDWRAAVEHLRQVEWVFLLPLLAGIAAAVLTLSGVIGHLLEEHAEAMSGLFLGLVAGSVVVAWELLQRRDLRRIGVLALAAVATFVLLGLTEGTTEESAAAVTDPALWAYLGAGALAICAMILPGISGSFLLVMIGMYGPVLDAVNERDLLPVAAVAIGCVGGLALFSQVLHWALNVHYDTVMAALIGLMLGSVRVLWPWPDGVESTALGAPGDPVAVPVVLAVIGLALVVVFHLVAKRLEHRSSAAEAAELQAS